MIRHRAYKANMTIDITWGCGIIIDVQHIILQDYIEVSVEITCILWTKHRVQCMCAKHRVQCDYSDMVPINTCKVP